MKEKWHQSSFKVITSIYFGKFLKMCKPIILELVQVPFLFFIANSCCQRKARTEPNVKGKQQQQQPKKKTQGIYNLYAIDRFMKENKKNPQKFQWL